MPMIYSLASFIERTRFHTIIALTPSKMVICKMVRAMACSICLTGIFPKLKGKGLSICSEWEFLPDCTSMIGRVSGALHFLGAFFLSVLSVQCPKTTQWVLVARISFFGAHIFYILMLRYMVYGSIGGIPPLDKIMILII